MHKVAVTADELRPHFDIDLNPAFAVCQLDELLQAHPVKGPGWRTGQPFFYRGKEDSFQEAAEHDNGGDVRPAVMTEPGLIEALLYDCGQSWVADDLVHGNLQLHPHDAGISISQLWTSVPVPGYPQALWPEYFVEPSKRFLVSSLFGYVFARVSEPQRGKFGIGTFPIAAGYYLACP